MKKVLLTAGICLFAGSVFAQMKNVNAAFNEAKMPKPNFGEARKSINEALKNPDTKDLAKTWYVAGFIENKSFESDYNKTLIKQSVNEKNMYNALLDSYEKYLVAAKLDTMPNEKGKVKSKYLKDIKNTIKNNQPHFWSAGAYFYNEKDYKVFEKDNLTLPTAVARTNESGIATFILPQEEWFAAQSQRFFTFVVQEGGGPDNYQIWSSGRTVEAGKVVKIEIRLTQLPN